MAEQDTYPSLGQNLNNPNAGPIPLAKGWIWALSLTVIGVFALLIYITYLAYVVKPPVPERVVSANGDLLFTGDDIRHGQQVFLFHGLHDNGSVFGHGAYLGPDFPSLTLHRMSLNAANELARSHFDKNYDELTHDQKKEMDALVPQTIRTNLYDPDTQTLVFEPFREFTWSQEPEIWKEYFRDPSKNGGLHANYITDPKELKDLSSYFAWAAWASSAPRPGDDYTYTNNFPFDPYIGNYPTDINVTYSAVSLLFLLGGTALALFFIGLHPGWEWQSPESYITPMVPSHMVSPANRALLKLVVLASFILLLQTLAGGGVAHFRAEPGSFYGWNISEIFPSNMLRTVHLQCMSLWISLGFITGGLFLSRVLGGEEIKGSKDSVDKTFWMQFVIIGGILFCIWLGLLQIWGGGLSFWIGSQGWEYLEEGRLWQILMIIGMFLWVIAVVKNVKPALKRPGTKALAIMFIIACFLIPLFFVPCLFYASQTHYTVVDVWRFWITHLWPEGMFEFFSTTVVAITFIEFGMVSREVGLRLIFLDSILIFMSGVVGTGHHWYFTGLNSFNMAAASIFSAMEVVPLVVLCAGAGAYWKTISSGPAGVMIRKFKWALYYMLAVGFWNFIGAALFGFLINTPIVSYFEIGTYLTPNHAHTAMFGVFGNLSIALMVLVLRQACTDRQWAKHEIWIKMSFWGFNIGLALMSLMSLVPGGFYQLWDVVQNGYWHGRSVEFTMNAGMSAIGWLRMPADLIFIVFGALPFFGVSVSIWLQHLSKKRYGETGLPKSSKEPVAPSSQPVSQAQPITTAQISQSTQSAQSVSSIPPTQPTSPTQR
ncbi:MAG: cbb3-type cytochrome c oxidase subunit I [Burkholderiales bacterium]|nr:cbb3-type cytochrome c oxidase subunit I [Burkholderiales bacterium]